MPDEDEDFDHEEETTPEVEPEADTDSIQDLSDKLDEKLTHNAVDVDVNDMVEIELPGADLSDETLEIVVLPVLPDEFTCEKCFLVVHKSRRAKEGKDICVDCY